MTKLFISANSDIKVETWLAIDNGKLLSWESTEEAAASEFGRKNLQSIVHIEAHFREPNFKDTSEVADLALAMESDGSFSMSVNQLRMERFARLLKSWNFKDENDKPMNANRQNVGLLNPQIALFLVGLLEDRLGLNAAEEPATQG